MIKLGKNRLLGYVWTCLDEKLSACLVMCRLCLLWFTFHSDGENFKLLHSCFSGGFGHPRLTSCEVLVWGGRLQFTGRGRTNYMDMKFTKSSQLPPSHWSRITSGVFLFLSFRLSRAAVLVAMQSSNDLATSTMTVLWVWWGGEVLLNQTVSGFLQEAPRPTVHSLSDTGTQLTQKLYSQVTKTPGCQEKVKKYQAIFCNDLTCYFYDILLPIFYADHVLAALLGRKTSERPHYSIDSFYTITQCAAWLCVNFHVLRCRFVIHDITAQTMFNHLQTITIFECWTKLFNYWLIFKVIHNSYIELLYNCNQDMH